MTGPEIAPCPFCGAKPSVGPFANAVTIHCANDDCDVGVETSAITEAEAIRIWNTRAPASLSDEQVEAVADVIGSVKCSEHDLRTVLHAWWESDYPSLAETEYAAANASRILIETARAALTAALKEKE